MDIDAAGGAATAGLIAGAVERPAGHAGDLHGNCTDCGEPVAGNFCANCGQPTHVHRTLLHLVEEVLHGVMHFDARIWRTLPLLAINPGRLTREWVEGRRARYVSPLAMFLFTVFLTFFLFSFSGGLEPKVTTTLPDRIAASRTAVAEAEKALQEAEADAQTGEPGSAGVAVGMRAALDAARDRLASLEAAQAEGGKRADGLEPGSWQADIHDAVVDGRLKTNLGNEHLNEKVRKKLLNPDLALYKLQQTTYKFAFLLVPLSIPFVALLFLWRRGWTLYDHGVFVLYSLTAMSILFALVSVLGALWSPLAIFGSLAVIIGVPVHMFAQLRGAYGLSIFSAGWRTLALLIFCTWVISLFFLSIVLLGLTG